jgi:hypothetical protein
MREIDCQFMSLSSPAEDIARTFASADSDVDGNQLDQSGYENTTQSVPDERRFGTVPPGPWICCWYIRKRP